MTLTKLVPALALLLLAAAPCLADDPPVAPTLHEEAAGVYMETSAEAPALAETGAEVELPADFAPLLPVELELMGLESTLPAFLSGGLGYCYHDCSACEGLGPVNPSCTSPDYPGVQFPCTSIPLC